MKKLLLILGLYVAFWPLTVQAETYCKNYNKNNVYEEAYCKLNLNNQKFEETIAKNIAKQLGYNEEVTTWILSQGENFTCKELKKYTEEKKIKAGDLHNDIKRACKLNNEDKLKNFLSPAPSEKKIEKETKEERKERKEEEKNQKKELEKSKLTGSPRSLEDVGRLLKRLKLAYSIEKNLQSNKIRLEETFKASERYWDGQLELSTPFDLMVDLNLMDDILFGSKAQWVNDSFAFAKGQDPQTNNNPPFLEPSENAEQEEENNPILEGEEGQINLTPPFVHPDCLNVPQQASGLCGNGVVDVLSGESCDDGNKVEGDGCNNDCKNTAGSLQCKDPEVLTLQNFATLPMGENKNPLCPPGILNQQNQSNENTSGSVEENQSQSPPPEAVDFVGGTLSPLPVVDSPTCPAGKSLVKVSVAGGGKGKEVSKCIPTDFCGDFNAIRNALFGEGWEESENADIAASIETAVCVNVSTANRPLSPYAVNEGCIDCHFRGMADALEKALSSNVTPLTNTTSAFALSNRWGPNFSFDLNIATKRLANLDLEKRSKEKSEEEKKEEKESNSSADAAINKAAENSKSAESSLQDPASSTDALASQVTNSKETAEAISDTLKHYQALSGSTSEMAFSSQVIPQIAYLKGSFQDIQSSMNSIVNITQELSVKPVCKL